jgi:radical S-adenosyl methionine domain-containing protein 2
MALTPSAPVETVNFHLWQPCNMRCKFCFATFRDVRDTVLPAGHLPRDQAMHVVRALSRARFRKITFAGGEPLLCPWIVDLVKLAKAEGVTTSLVTNGTLLDNVLLAQLRPVLDWLTLSVDSVQPDVLRLTGRMTAGRPKDEAWYRDLCARVHAAGLQLKINTVVTSANWQDDLVDFIMAAGPKRWKIFQVLPITGQNSGKVEPFLITTEQFDAFLDHHRVVEHHGIPMVPESNAAMLASYAMVDPAGRFFDSVGTDGGHTYSEPILDVGVRTALSQVTVSRDKFLARGGLYDDSAVGTTASFARLARTRLCRTGQTVG